MTSSAKNADTSRDANRWSDFRQIARLARIWAVERFSTLVPFSFNRRPTNVVREQFWGRAARAFLTRKSRNARFIFHVVFDSSLACQPLPAERK